MASGLFGQGGGLSGQTFGFAGQAVTDLFSADAARVKGQGDFAEAKNYDLAAGLADQNAQFTEMATAIKTFQEGRDITRTISGQQADVASAGFGESGSAIDLLRDSASQGALQLAMTKEQGLIQEAGYREQAESYRTMAAAETAAGNEENKLATGMDISSALAAAAAVVTIL